MASGLVHDYYQLRIGVCRRWRRCILHWCNGYATLTHSLNDLRRDDALPRGDSDVRSDYRLLSRLINISLSLHRSSLLLRGISFLGDDHLYFIVAIAEHDQRRGLLAAILRVGCLRCSPPRHCLGCALRNGGFRTIGSLTSVFDRRVIASHCTIRMLRALSRRRHISIVLIASILRFWWILLIRRWSDHVLLRLRTRGYYIRYITHVVNIWLSHYHL